MSFYQVFESINVIDQNSLLIEKYQLRGFGHVIFLDALPSHSGDDLHYCFDNVLIVYSFSVLIEI